MTAPGDSDRTAAIPVPEGEPREPEILLRVAARTDKGMVRENNEDAFLVADLGPPAADGEKTQDVNRVGRKGVLLAVSDGMGGQ